MSVAWSYSYLTAYETCPRRFALTRIYKTVTEPQTEATISGNEVHKAIELHIKNEQHLPDKYKRYVPIVDTVKRSPGVKHAEYRFGLTKQLRPTGFFAKDVWVRGVFDVMVVQPKKLVLLDWKTGTPRSDIDQLDLFAGVGFSLFQHVESVKAAYVWLAHGRVDPTEYSRDNVADLWKGFRARVERLESAVADEQFPPKPSGLCKSWCPVNKRQCEFSGRP